jgi:hypothetical protein
LAGYVRVEIGANLEAVPLEEIVDKAREKIRLFWAEETSSDLIESTSQVRRVRVKVLRENKLIA